MSNPAPGFETRPDHTITLARKGEHVRVIFNGETVADTRDAITMREASYPAVYYIPMRDIDRSRLAPSDHHTTCPFKGEASYYDLLAGSAREANAVWYYATPYDEVAEIADHAAFYPDKVELKVLD